MQLNVFPVYLNFYICLSRFEIKKIWMWILGLVSFHLIIKCDFRHALCYHQIRSNLCLYGNPVPHYAWCRQHNGKQLHLSNTECLAPPIFDVNQYWPEAPQRKFHVSSAVLSADCQPLVNMIWWLVLLWQVCAVGGWIGEVAMMLLDVLLGGKKSASTTMISDV